MGGETERAEFNVCGSSSSHPAALPPVFPDPSRADVPLRIARKPYSLTLRCIDIRCGGHCYIISPIYGWYAPQLIRHRYWKT